MLSNNSNDVICINPKNSTQLFKGVKYKCVVVSNRYARTEYYIRLYNISGTFPLDMFTLVNGEPIPKKDFVSDNNRRVTLRDIPHNELVGTPVLCDNNKLRTLSYGKLYYISEVEYGTHMHYLARVKLKGQSQWYSHWNFRVLPKDINREIELSKALDISSEYDELTNYSDNVGRGTMVKNLLSAFLDAIKYKEKITDDSLTFLEIMKKRSFSKYGIKQSDFSQLNDINWEDIIKEENL